jgi:hypothetical protein
MTQMQRGRMMDPSPVAAARRVGLRRPGRLRLPAVLNGAVARPAGPAAPLLVVPVLPKHATIPVAAGPAAVAAPAVAAAAAAAPAAAAACSVFMSAVGAVALALPVALVCLIAAAECGAHMRAATTEELDGQGTYDPKMCLPNGPLPQPSPPYDVTKAYSPRKAALGIRLSASRSQPQPSPPPPPPPLPSCGVTDPVKKSA